MMKEARKGKEEEEGFKDLQEGGFMELLGSGDLLELEKDEGVVLEEEEGFFLCPSSSSSSTTTTHMLCFGGPDESLFPNGFYQKSSDSSLSTLSSSPTSTATTATTKNRASRKLGSSGGGRRANTATITSKKPKTESSLPLGANKMRKAKLGERIVALQQLVSPFGKSDTASVLHEALGYIRFLHDQVQVLSSPYLQHLPSSDRLHEEEGEVRYDLRNRGLCLVPVSSTEHVANNNGADFWSPAMGSNPSSKH